MAVLQPFLAFFGRLQNVFHKTEIQTVMLRCVMVLILNWFKSYNTNEKHAKMQKCKKRKNHPKQYMDLFWAFWAFWGFFLTKNAQKQKYLRFV